MITLAANVFRNMLISSAKLKGKPAFSRHPVAVLAGSRPASSEFQPGILATLHKSGNGLNSNPHVHLIGTREIIDTKTGEIIENVYMPYKKIRHVWAGFIATSCRCAGRFASCFLKEAFLNHLVKHNILTAEESAALNNKFANGFAAPCHPWHRGISPSMSVRYHVGQERKVLRLEPWIFIPSWGVCCFSFRKKIER